MSALAAALRRAGELLVETLLRQIATERAEREAREAADAAQATQAAASRTDDHSE